MGKDKQMISAVNPADPTTIRKFVNRLPIPRRALPVNYDRCKGKWPITFKI